MTQRNFNALIRAKWEEGKFLCVGLDPDMAKMPGHLLAYGMSTETLLRFNAEIIDATKDFACAYKPNVAFYERFGAAGRLALHGTIQTIRMLAPDVPVILDGKRADIEKTNTGYVAEAFEVFDADALTVHPYLGAEAMQPFLARSEKGIFVLCRTSNPGAGEFQDLKLENGRKLFEQVAENVATGWNQNGNCGLVSGATYPEELGAIRGIVGDMPLLIPGIGSQGGDVAKTVAAGQDSRGMGMIINSSSGIIHASQGEDFAEVAHRKAARTHESVVAHLR